MTLDTAIIWLVPGFAITAIDAWLSIQSLTGIMQPKNPLAVVVAGLLGAFLTILAVISPIWGAAIRKTHVKLVRYTLLVFDIATSIVGAIWYGALGHKLNEAVDFHKIKFVPANWFVTCLFIAVVLLVAFVCHMFGKAMKVVMQNRERLRNEEKRT
jgi:hypothetical protein